MERMEAKLDKIADEVAKIHLTLARNTASLEEHMRRTALLEQQMLSLPQRVLTYLGILGGATAFIKNLL